jgi:hypothetical protein
VDAVHEHLRGVRRQLDDGAVPLGARRGEGGGPASGTHALAHVAPSLSPAPHARAPLASPYPRPPPPPIVPPPPPPPSRQVCDHQAADQAPGGVSRRARAAARAGGLGWGRRRPADASVQLPRGVLGRAPPPAQCGALTRPAVRHAPQVAMRRRAAGKREGTNPGETVPYVICVRIEPPAESAPAESAPAGGGAATAGIKAEPADGGAATPAPAGVKAEPADGAAPGSEQQQQQQQAGGSGGAPASPAPAAPARTPGKPATASGGGAGHIAERAFHPDELREDPTLAIDRE